MIELDGEKYLDGDEASNLLGVKMSTLYTYVSRGIIRSYKQGIKRQRLYKQAELESLLRLRPSDTSSPISTTRQLTQETSEINQRPYRNPACRGLGALYVMLAYIQIIFLDIQPI